MKVHLSLVALLVLATAVSPISVRAQAINGLRVGLSAGPTVRLVRGHPVEMPHVAADTVARSRPSYLGAIFGFLAGAVLALGVHREDKVVVLGAVGAVIGLVVGP